MSSHTTCSRDKWLCSCAFRSCVVWQGQPQRVQMIQTEKPSVTGTYARNSRAHVRASKGRTGRLAAVNAVDGCSSVSSSEAAAQGKERMQIRSRHQRRHQQRLTDDNIQLPQIRLIALQRFWLTFLLPAPFLLLLDTLHWHKDKARFVKVRLRSTSVQAFTIVFTCFSAICHTACVQHRLRRQACVYKYTKKPVRYSSVQQGDSRRAQLQYIYRSAGGNNSQCQSSCPAAQSSCHNDRTTPMKRRLITERCENDTQDKPTSRACQCCKLRAITYPTLPQPSCNTIRRLLCFRPSIHRLS